MTLKSDLIAGMYSKIRISGLTVQPSPADNRIALEELENMMAEFFENNIDVNYYFEETPNAGTKHCVKRAFWSAIQSNLAVRMCPNFGKDANQILLGMQQAGYSFLASATDITRKVPYPSRMPRGSADIIRARHYPHYMGQVEQVPLESKSITMNIGDTNDFIESFVAYLVEGETISSYTIEADTGLTIDSYSLSGGEITYRITADGLNIESANSLLRVRIVVTTSDSRVETRVINFELIDTSLT